MQPAPPDLTLITAHDPAAASHAAWAAFVRALFAHAVCDSTLVYGRDELLASWTWFRTGWDAQVKLQRTLATERWCNET